jgi:hypothetical protein
MASQFGAPLRTPPGYPGILDDIIVRINEMQSQIDAVKSRCHCEHVDYHDVQIRGLINRPAATDHHDERWLNASRSAKSTVPIERSAPSKGTGANPTSEAHSG